jgi:hypothetical protein
VDRLLLQTSPLLVFPVTNHKGPNVAGIDPDTQALTQLFHPRQDDWSEHFIWNGPELTGKTVIGRVTIAVLAINLPHRIALRQALIEEGAFPPE